MLKSEIFYVTPSLCKHFIPKETSETTSMLEGATEPRVHILVEPMCGRGCNPQLFDVDN